MYDETPDIPPLSLRLIKWFCHKELHEEIEGNLIEYANTIESNSKWSKWKYWIQVITYLRWSTMKKISHHSKFYIMFNFNIILTFRNLWRNRTTTFLNIGGYSIGMLCVALLYFYIQDELAYDQFHKNKNEIYRVIRTTNMNGEFYKIGVTSGPYAEGLKLDFPSEIKSTLRIYSDQGLVTYKNKKFNEKRMFFADENFFDFLSFKLNVGDPKTALKEPNSIVLTRSAAEKYFGYEDPLGKVLTVDNYYKLIVTGIMEDPPAKSHLEFDFVCSLNLYQNLGFLKGWWNNGLITYIQVENPLMAETIQDKFPAFMDKYFKKDFDRTGNRIDIALQPFNDIYFENDMKFDWVKHGNLDALYLLGIVGIAILFIACFNYLNLAIALSFKRAKEVGMRKVLGGNKFRLTLQFLGESFLIALIAILLAISLTEIAIPTFNRMFDLEITTNWLDQTVLTFFSILLFMTVLFSGLYPALLLASFEPIAVLKGKFNIKKGNLWIRKGLVIAQFIISIFLIISTLMIGKQLDFVKEKNLGFNKEAIVIVRIDNKEIRDKSQLFKERLLTNAAVLSVSKVMGAPGGFHDATTLEFNGKRENVRMRIGFCDVDYVPTFKIDLIAGRGFSATYSQDELHGVIINEMGASELEMTPEEVVGTKFYLNSYDTLQRTIIGVAKNYHFSSLKEQIEPMIMVAANRPRKIAVRLDAGKIPEGLAIIKEAYEEFVPTFPYNYSFLDENLDRLYAEEQQQGKIFEAFSGISIFLACLGIFGLVSFAVEQRRKEFGIRKALGARSLSIIQLISKDFIVMIIFSSIIAIPLAYYLLDSWLVNFAYRIDLLAHWVIFVSGGLFALLLAVVTIFFRSYKAAISNPTDSLRYE
jgi:putative ABC transport system permease protein